MEKIAIITDTAADLDQEVVERFGIRVLPFRIIYPDREYRDGVDITPEKVYQDIQKIWVKSSIPSMEEMEQMFTELVDQGFTHAIVVTLSGGLSGIFNSVRLVSERYPDIVTHVEDSKSISMGEGLLAIRAAEMVQQGASFDEIITAIGELKTRIKLYFVVETLEYLMRGGRIGRVSGTVAEKLNVKPVIASSLEDGKYYTVAKVRGRKKSIDKLVSLATEFAESGNVKAYILHGDARDEMLDFAEQVRQIPGIIEVSTAGNITPVAGVHSGPGLIGLVLLSE